MKKLLAIALTLALLLGLAVPAMAQQSTSGPNLATAVVTAMEVEWDGTIEWLDHRTLRPGRFSERSVTVTLHVEGYAPVVLDRWSGVAADSVAWNVWSWTNHETNTVTVYFENKHLVQAYEATYNRKWQGNTPEFFAMLPRASFALPENVVELFINQQPFIPALSVNSANQSQHRLLTFTPQRSGYFRVSGVNLHTDVVILNSRFEEIARERPRNFESFSIHLEGGETYYIFNDTRDVLINNFRGSLWQSFLMIPRMIIGGVGVLAMIGFFVPPLGLLLLPFFLLVAAILTPLGWISDLFS